MRDIDTDPVMKKTKQIAAIVMTVMVIYFAIDLPVEYMQQRKFNQQMQPATEKLRTRQAQIAAQRDSLEQLHKKRVDAMWDAGQPMSDINADNRQYQHQMDSLDQEYLKACTEYDAARQMLLGKNR